MIEKKNEIDKKNREDIISLFEGRLKRAVEEASENGEKKSLVSVPKQSVISACIFSSKVTKNQT